MPRIAKLMGPLEIGRLTAPGYHPVGGVPGLTLQITPGKSKSWLLRVKVGTKRREIGLGAYPGVGVALAHDDGQSNRNLEEADVILVGVSRSGKTPTSLYLSMQYGLKAANCPLIPEDFERQQLPPALLPHKKKIFGLSIQPERLSEIRNERRPNSRYASLDNCRMEVSEAEAMMRRAGIRWLSTTTKSIEEIATTILQEIRPERLVY